MSILYQYRHIRWGLERKRLPTRLMLNCYDFVAHIWQTEKEHSLPNYHAAFTSQADAAEQFSNHRRQWRQVISQDFALILMGDKSNPNHIGVLRLLHGQSYVLHCVKGANVLCTPLNEIQQRYILYGYYFPADYQG